MQELITKGELGAQQYEHNYEGRWMHKSIAVIKYAKYTTYLLASRDGGAKRTAGTCTSNRFF